MHMLVVNRGSLEITPFLFTFLVKLLVNIKPVSHFSVTSVGYNVIENMAA